MKPRTANVVAKVSVCVFVAAFVALALFLTAPLFYVWWFDLPDPAKWEKARTEMGEIQKALELHARENGGRYPTELRLIAPMFPGRRLPLDPWTKQPFAYESDGRGFRLVCLGKDGKPGGAISYDLDIVYTETSLP